MALINSIEPIRSSARRQRGFTMVELMIALLMGLFLMSGLLIILQDNKRSFTTQNQLAKLQDTERLAMTMLGDAIQQAGYFPDPTTYTAASVFFPTGQYPIAGQALFGTYNGSGTGDTIYVRFASVSGDGTLDCFGLPNTTTATPNVMGGQFYAYGGQLWCGMGFQSFQLVGEANGAVQPIGVTSLSFLYGVNSTATTNNVDTYKNASQMSAADWNNVMSVQFTVTLSNPLYTATNQGQGMQPPTVSVTRVVDIMRQTGI